MWIELLGILASLLVLISFLFKSEFKIRIVNIAGAIMFVIYGFLISSFSVQLLNFILVIVHIRRLKQLKDK